MRKIIPLILLIGVLISLNCASAQASLVLYADPSLYVTSHADPWFVDSWLTGPDDFTLTLSNTFVNNDIKNIRLVIALKEDTKSGLSIDIDGNTLDASDFTNSGSHPYMTDSHGVFGADTYFYDYWIGDLTKLNSLDLDIAITTSGSPIVHFDAYGYKVKNTGDLQLINNPNSKDVTWDPPLYWEYVENPPRSVVPEPATLMMLGLGFGGLLRFKRRK